MGGSGTMAPEPHERYLSMDDKGRYVGMVRVAIISA